MHKYLWSTVILMLATSVATYLAATCRNCPNCLSDKYVKLQAHCVQLSEVTPLVLSTQPPPFIIEPIEPIALEPEPRYSTPTCPDGIITCSDFRAQSPTLLRMPYADEESPAWGFWTMVYGLFNQILPDADGQDGACTDDCKCQGPESPHGFILVNGRLVMRPIQVSNVEVPSVKTEVAADGSWRRTVADLVQQFLPLPGSDLEPIDPGIEVPRESTPPLQQEETTKSSDTMPMPAVDYHQQHPGCTRFNNYPYGGCPTFPPPAYPFERTMPSNESLPPPM